MVRCKLDGYDTCTSCKVCGYELSQILLSMRKSLDVDKKQGIDSYPFSFVAYLVNVMYVKVMEDVD